MEYSLQQKADKIIETVKKIEGIDPVKMFVEVAKQDYINIHGPEHHVLDAACLLRSYQNAGGILSNDRSFDEAFEKIKFETLRMPGAACALWGVCGAISSAGSVLSVIDGTGPLSTDGTWGEHMKYTSEALAYMGQINGPRCCKRDAFIAFTYAIDYIEKHYGVVLEKSAIQCEFSSKNMQCIGEKCPFHAE